MEQYTNAHGVIIKVGQKWKEVDPRFDRIFEVVGFTEEGRVKIRTLGWSKITHANPQRFNGKRTSRAEEELKHAELAFSIWDSLAPIDLKIKVGDEIRRMESVGGLSVCSPSTTPNPEKQ